MVFKNSVLVSGKTWGGGIFCRPWAIALHTQSVRWVTDHQMWHVPCKPAPLTFNGWSFRPTQNRNHRSPAISHHGGQIIGKSHSQPELLSCGKAQLAIAIGGGINHNTCIGAISVLRFWGRIELRVTNRKNLVFWRICPQTLWVRWAAKICNLLHRQQDVICKRSWGLILPHILLRVPQKELRICKETKEILKQK